MNSSFTMQGPALLLCLLVAVIGGSKAQWNPPMACLNKIYACSTKFHALYHKQQYEEAMEEIKSARKCLDNITCGGEVVIQNVKNLLKEALVDYKSGVLTGKCNARTMQKCQTDFPTGLNHGKAARKCMEEIKPECFSDKQREMFDFFMKEVENL